MVDDNRRDFLAAGAGIAAASFAAIPEAQAQQQAQPAKRPGRLSTHVLDTYNGMPGAGMKIEFFILDGNTYRFVKTVQTNADGRTDEPLLPVEGMAVGRYQLVFYVADYFNKAGLKLPEPPFLDKVAIYFSIFDPKQHYHVPLLCSPWSYTTYRGS